MNAETGSAQEDPAGPAMGGPWGLGHRCEILRSWVEKFASSRRYGAGTKGFPPVGSSPGIGARLAPSNNEHHVYRSTIILIILIFAGAQNAILACDACCYMQAEPACSHGPDSTTQQLASPQDPCSSDSTSPVIGPEGRGGFLHNSSDAGVLRVDSPALSGPARHFTPVRALARPHFSPQSLNLRI